METQTANNHGPWLIYGTSGFNQHQYVYNGVTQESPGPKQVKGTGSLSLSFHHLLTLFNVNVHLLILRPLTQTDHRQEHFYPLLCFELINISGWLRGVLHMVLARGGRGPGCSVRWSGASRGGAALVRRSAASPSLPPLHHPFIHLSCWHRSMMWKQTVTPSTRICC